MLNGAQDAAREIAAELGGCRDCIARLAAIDLGNYASALAHMAGEGGAQEAAKWVERGLMEDIDRGRPPLSAG